MSDTTIQFRETEGGGLEVLQNGVWTSVPHSAAAAIKHLWRLLQMSRPHVSDAEDDTLVSLIDTALREHR